MIQESERPGDDAASVMRTIKCPPFEEPPAAGWGKLSAARSAALAFLFAELGTREGRITKITPGCQGAGGWTAEAEVLVPNLEVKMLGLPLNQEVLEVERYALDLNDDLSITSYELLAADSR